MEAHHCFYLDRTLSLLAQNISREPSRSFCGNHLAIGVPKHKKERIFRPAAFSNSWNSLTEYSCLDIERYLGQGRPVKVVQACAPFRNMRTMERALGTEMSNTPFGHSTRANSCRQARGLGTYSRTLEQSTPSKELAGNGKASMVFTCPKLTGSALQAWDVNCLATRNISSAASTASTLHPCSASHRDKVPVPQPASSQVVAFREIPARHFSTTFCRYAKERLLYFCSHWAASWP